MNDDEEIVNTMEPLTQSCWTSFDLKENPSVKDKERKAGGKVKENTQSISKTRSTSSNTSTISSKNPTAFKLVKLSTMERDCWTQLVFKEKPAVKGGGKHTKQNTVHLSKYLNHVSKYLDYLQNGQIGEKPGTCEKGP